MYSGTTFHHKSGNVIGVHQKINKVAYRIAGIEKDAFFPVIKDILHFEGKNGPDGIKRKNPGSDEPWHFIDPMNLEDTDLIEQIVHHAQNLQDALRIKDEKKSAFEAAWLAHAIVDGLTPAHHFPLEEHLEEIRGEPKETRDSVRKKLLLPGDGNREKLKNNWQFWGAKGVMTSHLLFELGVASAITPLRSSKITLSEDDLKEYQKIGLTAYYRSKLQEISGLHMYETFTHWGWTPTLARQTRSVLIPIIIKTVALAWMDQASQASKK